MDRSAQLAGLITGSPLLLIVALLAANAALAANPEAVEARAENIVMMKAFTVNSGPTETFGFTVSMHRDAEHSSWLSPRFTLVVMEVYPNTAAAKAGLRPGDRILRSDGASVEFIPASDREEWEQAMPWRKEADLEAGKPVSWKLAIRSDSASEIRNLTLALPTPPPRWGAASWTLPRDHPPLAFAVEPGPLADRAETILENGIAVALYPLYARLFKLNFEPYSSYFGYEWIAPQGRRMIVRQRRGQTEIILEGSSPPAFYLTQPDGRLRATIRLIGGAGNPWSALSLRNDETGFQQEVDFWRTRMGKVSPRWPLEPIATR